MALQEEFESEGNWLFRWRGYIPILILALCLIALPERGNRIDGPVWDFWWELGCLLVSFVGLGIRALTLGFVSSRTSGRNTRAQRADSLNTSGMYSIVRHPLYLGNAFAGLGIVLFTYSWWMTLVYLLSFWIYYERIMFSEEHYLRNKFGAHFVEWSNRTPAFIPRLRNWKRPTIPFSVRTVLRREYNSLLAVIGALFILEAAGDLSRGKSLEIDTSWAVLLTAGLVAWVVLRTLGKATKVLSEADR